jgi:hypothetical protein
MDRSVRHCLRPSLTLWVHNQLFGFVLISNWGGHEIFRRLGKQILSLCVYMFIVRVCVLRRCLFICTYTVCICMCEILKNHFIYKIA